MTKGWKGLVIFTKKYTLKDRKYLLFGQNNMVISREEYHRLKGDKKLYGHDDCPFCESHETKIREGTYRMILTNLGSYTGTNEHIMVIPKAHKVFMTDLDHHEIMELPLVFQAVKDIMGQKEYFSCVRETIDSGRSVEHLHIHYMPGKLQGKYLRNMLQNQGFPIIQQL